MCICCKDGPPERLRVSHHRHGFSSHWSRHQWAPQCPTSTFAHKMEFDFDPFYLRPWEWWICSSPRRVLSITEQTNFGPSAKFATLTTAGQHTGFLFLACGFWYGETCTTNHSMTSATTTNFPTTAQAETCISFKASSIISVSGILHE